MPEFAAKLRHDPALADADATYAALVEAHRGLTAADSAAVNARLVLLLANHIGDGRIIAEAIASAGAADGLGRIDQSE